MVLGVLLRVEAQSGTVAPTVRKGVLTIHSSPSLTFGLLPLTADAYCETLHRCHCSSYFFFIFALTHTNPRLISNW